MTCASLAFLIPWHVVPIGIGQLAVVGDRLVDRLVHAHGYAPASAMSFVQELRDLAFCVNNAERKPGQIVTLGVSEAEPPRRSFAEARLLIVVLDYVAPEEWGLVNRVSPQVPNAQLKTSGGPWLQRPRRRIA